MQLPQTAEYALRAMASIARHQGVVPLRSADLSEVAEVPSYYLSKVLRKLVVADLLRSQKGHGGGFVLSKPADQIRFLDILLAVGYQPNMERCVFGWGGCDGDHPCPLHEARSAFNESFWNWATTTTLDHARHEVVDWHSFRTGR